MAQHGKVLGGRIATQTTGVFVQAHIQHRVQTILDAPVRTHRAQNPSGAARQTAQEITSFQRGFGPDLMLALEQNRAAQPDPLLLHIPKEGSFSERVTR